MNLPRHRLTHGLALLGLALIGLAATVPAKAATRHPIPIPIHVVVVTTFEVGADTGDTPGELQNWVAHYPMSQSLAFPQGFHALRYNAKDHVLVLLTGVGKAHAAASVMALGLDPRFDLTHAYWILAGIGGVDPAVASVGSAAWAPEVIDGDLAYEIDTREAPKAWETGIVPYDRSEPYQAPTPADVSANGGQVYHLNRALTDWAYHLTAGLTLPDDDRLKAARAGYPDDPGAQKPPFVLEGDTLTADRFWLGAGMTLWAEHWVSYWTHGQGVFTTSAEEDTGYLQALTFLAQAHRVDLNRALDLRTASDFARPPKGVSVAEFLKSEAIGNYAGYLEAINNAYRVGAPVVRELAGHWDRYRDNPPGEK